MIALLCRMHSNFQCNEWPSKENLIEDAKRFKRIFDRIDALKLTEYLTSKAENMKSHISSMPDKEQFGNEWYDYNHVLY